MSKSYGNSIMLGATAEETAKLIKKSPTDSERRITFRRLPPAVLRPADHRRPGDRPRPEGHPPRRSVIPAPARSRHTSSNSVNEFLAPHRERRAELAKDMDSIRDILHDGNKRANAIAEETLDQVREAMGMKY